MADAKRPREEIFEGSETVPKFSKIEDKREEEEEEEDDEEIMSTDEEIVSLYSDVPSKERPLEDGWESEGDSCFDGRHVNRTDGRCLVMIPGDIMENRDKIIQVLNHHQDAWHSQGFNIQNDVPLPYKGIDVLNYECEDPILKDNIYYHVQLAIDVYNKKSGGQRNLEFVDIVRVNISLGFYHVFYVTLLAKETRSAKVGSYQTRISTAQCWFDDPLPASMVRVHVFRPTENPKLRLPVRWAFVGSGRTLRKYGLKGAYFEGTSDEALAFLELKEREHAKGSKQKVI